MSRTINKPEKYYVGMYVAPQDFPQWMSDMTVADPKWFPHVTMHYFGELGPRGLTQVENCVRDWSGRGADPIALVATEITKFGGGYALELADDDGHVDRIWLGLADDPRIGTRRDTTYDLSGVRLHLSLPASLTKAEAVNRIPLKMEHKLSLTGPVLVSNKRGIIIK